MAQAQSLVVYPPNYGPESEHPPLFDGTTRLYLSYICPFARRAWILVNYKGLHDKVQFVPFDLKNRPNWYKEKVYPVNKVPALEHDNQVVGDSLEVLKYMDDKFDGPKVIPQDPEKREFAEEMLAYSSTFCKVVFGSANSELDPAVELGPALDHLENCLSRLEDGPFFVGEFSIAEIAYATVVEKAQTIGETKKYDIAAGRPKLKLWIEEMHKIEAYTVTKVPPHA